MDNIDKLKMQTDGLRIEKMEVISKYFPSCITKYVDDEGITSDAIDFEALKRELSDHIIDGNRERYVFTWPEKSTWINRTYQDTQCTLRPLPSKSVDFETTGNVFIEGDNLEALKVMREVYCNKVKMIYIDPPYNTGNDFIYIDKFSLTQKEYAEISGDYDENGYPLTPNPSSTGRFHTNWLNMIYSRLLLARDLLSDDGVIFISIDEKECHNLAKACDEIFGSLNKVGTVIWERTFSPKNDAKFISASHDYILVYAKSISDFNLGKLTRTEEANARYKNRDNDPRGPWMSSDLTVKTYTEEYDYELTLPSGKKVKPTAGRCWCTSKERMQELIDDNRIWFGKKGSNNTPRLKRFLSEVQDCMVPTSIWTYDEVGHNQEGRQELKKIFSGKGYFDGPKPTRLILRILDLANLKPDSIVMDFFAGSATTADAVFKYNLKTGKNCKFILVQLPEPLSESTQAYRDGYKTICDIGEERLRIVGRLLKRTSDRESFDTGFRVFKVDSSNMNDVYYSPSNLTKNILANLVDSVKQDRTGDDLLFQTMLECGVDLSAKIACESIFGHPIFSVDVNYMIACFDQNITDDVVIEIAKRQPRYVVFRDASMSSDAVTMNYGEIFKTYSPNTKIKVL